MIVVISQLFVLAVVLLFTRAVVHRMKFRDFYRLPIPPGALLIGHSVDFGAPDQHRRFTRFANKYGGIYRLRLFSQNVVMLTDPALIANVLAKTGLNLPKSVVYQQFNQFFCRNPKVETYFTLKYDDEHYKSLRKPLVVAFSTDSLRDNAFPIALVRSVKLTEQLEIESRAHPEAVVNIDILLQRFIFDFVGKWGFGVEFNTLDGKNADIFHAFHRSKREMMLAAAYPWRIKLFRLFPFLPEAKATLSVMERTHMLFEDLALSIKARGTPSDNDNSPSACLARMTDYASGQPLTTNLEAFAATTGVFLVGAFDTTSHQTGWLLYQLARNPNVQRKLRDELAAAGFLFEGTTMEAGGKLPTFADLLKLPYTNCVIKESLRFHAVAATGTLRETDNVIKVNGIEFPKGTAVGVSFYAVCRSRHNYPDADTFRPERWQSTSVAINSTQTDKQEDQRQAPLNGKPPPLHTTPPITANTPSAGAGVGVGRGVGRGADPAHFMPFGMGPRDCAGQNLAMMMLRLLCVVLCGRYWFEVAAEMGSEEEVAQRETMALVLTYPGGIKLRCIQHAAMKQHT